jgi:hypothetical protein
MERLGQMKDSITKCGLGWWIMVALPITSQKFVSKSAQ